MIQLTLESPSLPSLVGYVSTSPRPLSRNRVPLRLTNDSTASLVLDHSSSLFSTNRDVFVHLIVENETDSLIPYTLSSQAAFSSVLRPDSQGIFVFSTGVNCSSEASTRDEVFGYLMLDFSTKLLFDSFSLLFAIDSFEGDIEVALSDRVFSLCSSHSRPSDPTSSTPNPTPHAVPTLSVSPFPRIIRLCSSESLFIYSFTLFQPTLPRLLSAISTSPCSFCTQPRFSARLTTNRSPWKRLRVPRFRTTRCGSRATTWEPFRR